MLGLSLHVWENVMLIFLGVAAFAAVVVGISTYAVVRLQKVEANEAKKDLEEYKLGAGGKIADSNARAEEAKAVSAVASARAAEADARSAEANERASVAERGAAVARLETERLNASMAWRRISAEQTRILIATLKGKPIEVWLTFVGTDPESTVFREDINQALTAAGVKTKFFRGYEMAVGLKISNHVGPDRDLLIDAFKKAGLPLIESDSPGMKQLEIIVGTKPPPF